MFCSLHIYVQLCWLWDVEWELLLILMCQLEVGLDFLLSTTHVYNTKDMHFFFFFLMLVITAGVLFSIEVTSTYFPVRNYFYSFYCAVIAALLFRFVTNQPYPNPTHFPEQAWVYTELVFFALLGT